MRMRFLAIFLLPAALLLTGMKSVPTAQVITCGNLQLNQNYAAMEKALGKPWYSDNRLVYGRSVDYYIYHDKTAVGIAKKTGKIVDMYFIDDKYSLMKNIRMGATPYKMQSVYGKNEKTYLDGKAYFIYNDEKAATHRLLLQLDPMEDFLIGIRLTSLPLDDEEADEAAYDDDEQVDVLHEGQLDTSSVTTNKSLDNGVKIGFKYKKSW